MMRAALYARVSTDGQTVEHQLQALREVAAKSGWEVVEEFTDQGISGGKGRDKRPGFDRMLKAITRREVDMVAAWSVDRLGRSLQHLVGFLSELQDTCTNLYLHQQGIDTTTAAGRAMFQMCGVFAEFERSMIQDRIKAGLKTARARGVKLGRPPVSTDVENEVKRLRANGLGMHKAAERAGVSVSVVQRIEGRR